MNNYKINRYEISLGDIPLVVFRPEREIEKLKTIIYYHGWSSIVETYELFGRVFAHYGFQVVLPEVIKHGARGIAEDYGSYGEIPEVVVQSIKEFEYIKEFLINDLDADPKNIIISGHSMGGIIVSGIFVRDLSLKGMILYNTIANYREFVDELSDAEKENADEFITYDPMDRLSALNGRNALIFAAESDEVIPVDVMLDFQDRVRESGINAENIYYSFYSDSAHSISYKMQEEALRYVKYLFNEV